MTSHGEIDKCMKGFSFGWPGISSFSDISKSITYKTGKYGTLNDIMLTCIILFYCPISRAGPYGFHCLYYDFYTVMIQM